MTPRKTSRALARRRAKKEASEELKPTEHKILTAEGWRRLMLGKSRKSSTKAKA